MDLHLLNIIKISNGIGNMALFRVKVSFRKNSIRDNFHLWGVFAFFCELDKGNVTGLAYATYML